MVPLHSFQRDGLGRPRKAAPTRKRKAAKGEARAKKIRPARFWERPAESWVFGDTSKKAPRKGQ
jgi:hypothetical protein